jgi:3-oxoacyl-[acyl-carrier protein] reductase
VAKDGGKGILKQLPMRSFGDVEDVARLVVFLAGPESKYVTGSLFEVDGGASAMLGTGAPL